MSNIVFKSAALYLLLCLPFMASANHDSTLVSSTPSESFMLQDPNDPKTYDLDRIMERISVGGYYRFYGLLRTLENPWPVIPSNTFASTPPFIIGAGDVYRDPPLMLMTIQASPGGGATVGMDLALYHNFTGNVGQGALNLNLGTSLYGSINTGIGRFGVQTGGINWVEMSGFTFSSFAGYERFSVFERNAWEGIDGASNRYQFFFDQGTIQRDARWARQAFKGVVFDGYELPGRFSFRLMYGKTPATASLENNLIQYSTGGQLKKAIGTNGHVAFNTMNYISDIDSVSNIQSGLRVNTISGQAQIGELTISGEAGIAAAFISTVEPDWGEGIQLTFKTTEKLTKFPIELQVYRMSPKFVNYFASFLSFNSTIPGTDGQIQGVSAGGGGSFAGSITNVGQLSNNRQGLNLHSWLDLGSLKVNFGLGISQELEISSNRMSFGHRINGYPMSRFVPFSSGVGPYQRWTSFFRGVAEDVFITDLDEDGLPLSKTTFNMFQIHLKQRINEGRFPVYGFYVGSFGSASPEFSVIPEFSDNAYLRTHYHEFDIAIGLSEMFDVVFSYGLETIRGNHQTNNLYYFDDNGVLAGANVEFVEGNTLEQYGLSGSTIPGADYAGAAYPAPTTLNQESTHVGFGLDVNANDKTGIYIRHRRFTQNDNGFGGDNIKGHDTSVELKIYF